MSGVDHESVCPFLVRCFWKINCFHHMQRDWAHISKGTFPANELELRCWRDTSLLDIAEMLRTQAKMQLSGLSQSFSKRLPSKILNEECTFKLRRIFFDKDGKIKAEEIGQVLSSDSDGKQRVVLGKTNFEAGDLLDVAIILRQKDESKATIVYPKQSTNDVVQSRENVKKRPPRREEDSSRARRRF